MRISTRARTQTRRLISSERFPNLAISDNGYLIEEAMMDESKPIDYNQAMKDENWEGSMKE